MENVFPKKEACTSMFVIKKICWDNSVKTKDEVYDRNLL